ncbi:hypothetical protein [Flavobacterium ginsenosidimutans]|uniref:hypothetical protein n=1 Tax=Flavobacterium ginsenosidimutans TaxID=687844 RepID=UPI003D95BBDB
MATSFSVTFFGALLGFGFTSVVSVADSVSKTEASFCSFSSFEITGATSTS